MSFWSGSKLRTAFPVQSIVEPFDPSNIDCAAYTLTVGPEYFITPSFDTKQADSVRKVLAAGEKSSGVQTVGGGTLAIPPGQFAFLVTEEKLSIPTNVIGFISLKSKIKWSGLINVSGFHVDPDFLDFFHFVFKRSLQGFDVLFKLINLGFHQIKFSMKFRRVVRRIFRF